MSNFSNFFATFIIFTFFFVTVKSEITSFSFSLGNSSASIERPCGAWEVVNCPVSCFRMDPVCSVDGVTYWCGCADAVCAGAQVAKLGFCEVGKGDNVTISDQALMLVHIVCLILLGFFVVFGHMWEL